MYRAEENQNKSIANKIFAEVDPEISTNPLGV